VVIIGVRHLFRPKGLPGWLISFIGIVGSWAVGKFLDAAMEPNHLMWVFRVFVAVAIFGIGWIIGAAWPDRGLAYFFANRGNLKKAYPLDRQLAVGNKVYGCWVAGKGVFQENERYLANGSIQQLILPHPDTESLSKFGDSIATKEMYPVAADIRASTKLARRYQIKVRWYRGFVGVGVLIGNPGRADAWVTAEFTQPYVEPGQRQSIRLEADAQPEAVGAWFEWFGKMWDASEDPPMDP
jgi:hypothetical protein